MEDARPSEHHLPLLDSGLSPFTLGRLSIATYSASSGARGALSPPWALRRRSSRRSSGPTPRRALGLPCHEHLGSADRVLRSRSLSLVTMRAASSRHL